MPSQQSPLSSSPFLNHSVPVTYTRSTRGDAAIIARERHHLVSDSLIGFSSIHTIVGMWKSRAEEVMNIRITVDVAISVTSGVWEDQDVTVRLHKWKCRQI
jgi:hypothetical protein